jgi:3-methyl-2-oxobutanoate hydroxymethyltransferase
LFGLGNQPKPLIQSEGEKMARKKISINDLYSKKAAGEKVSWLTCYDYPTAQFQETAGIEMILVGDSMGMCVYGYSSTVPVTMGQCIVHSEAVRRGAPTAFVIGDMPFMSYQESDQVAVANAGRFLKEANVDAIKLEGGLRIASRIRAIVDAGIVVSGHIGLTPQSSGQLGGHKAQGRTAESAELVIRDALAVQEAGAQLLLLEAIPPELSSYITKKLSIPVYGIGAGPDTDGQLLIVSDMVGQFQAFTPKFVKKYCNVAEVYVEAFKSYIREVKSGKFPEDEHCYHIIKGQEESFAEMLKKFQ